MTRQSKKQVQNQSQSGRSMIEMLGVLAIIAVLSIGGIVGYKLAMNYYQADQIANEINLMRNDLKVKYALGNEELLLGDPYDDTPADEDYTGHLSTQYDRYPVDYDCIRKDKAEFYNCRETDAYYIKVGNVSKGVCKPLTTLVAAMDGRWEMDINGISYTEDDLCSSDENNEIYIEFDAEEVNGNYDSNRPEGWCGDDEDCEEPQVCDKESNTCVECVEDGNCNAPRSVCDVANHECVECIDHTDCKDSSKPRCNVEQGSCEPCPAETPKWNGEKCVECTTNANCFEKGTDEPVCNAENTCEPCPEGEEWNSEFKECVVTSCQENSDCNKNGHNHYYCHFDNTSDCSKQDGYSGRCIDKDEDVIVIEGTDFIAKMSDMSWWSAQNFCQANKKELANIVDLNCADSITPSSNGYCHQTKAGNTDYDPDNISNTVITLHATLGNHYFWLQEWYDEACPAGGVGLDTGRVDKWYVSVQYSNNFALCK